MNTVAMGTKELLYAFDLQNMMVLVPKTRGAGFLAAQLWHYASARFAPEPRDIADSVGCDVTGLDGYL